MMTTALLTLRCHPEPQTTLVQLGPTDLPVVRLRETKYELPSFARNDIFRASLRRFELCQNDVRRCLEVLRHPIR